jgi:hypothetical protein
VNVALQVFMTAPKSILVFLPLSVLTICASAQSPALLDTQLYAEKVTLCDLLDNYVNKRQEFKVVCFDTSFFSISSYDNNASIFGHWTYVVRNDSLSQLGFSSLALPITDGWFQKLSRLADSAIDAFTAKYGKPDRDTIVKKNFFQKGNKNAVGDIRKAMWVIDGQKLKVDFSIDGEHGQYSYLLRIQRFKDYYGNMKLPPWWDGY